MNDDWFFHIHYNRDGHLSPSLEKLRKLIVIIRSPTPIGMPVRINVIIKKTAHTALVSVRFRHGVLLVTVTENDFPFAAITIQCSVFRILHFQETDILVQIKPFL